MDMNLTGFFHRVFSKRKADSKALIVIINKVTEVLEYDSIEAALAELEKDLQIVDNNAYNFVSVIRP